jgi:Glycosyltransferase family 10 (fucosyltransferase) C-term
MDERESTFTGTRQWWKSIWKKCTMTLVPALLWTYNYVFHYSGFDTRYLYIKTSRVKQLVRSHNETLKEPLRIFICGYNHSDRIVQSLFPEYTRRETLTKKSNTTESDILFTIGQNGGQRCPISYGHHQEWLHEHFQGKAIFLNGEAYNDQRAERIYALGYLADSNRSIQVLGAAQVLMDYGPESWENLFFHKPINTSRQRFMIYAASHCVRYREEAVYHFSQIKVVDQGGRCGGRSGSNLKKASQFQKNKKWQSNHDLFRGYRFCLVLENSSVKGYITEKILNAFLGGCVPIYYGTQDVFEVFNKDAFIFYDINNPQPAIEKVAYLEANRTAYDEILTQPALANGNETIDKYFSLSDEIGNGTLKRRIRQLVGLH